MEGWRDTDAARPRRTTTTEVGGPSSVLKEADGADGADQLWGTAAEEVEEKQQSREQLREE